MEAIITSILTKAFTEYGLLVALLIILVMWLLKSFKKTIEDNTTAFTALSSKLTLILDAVALKNSRKE